MLSLGAPACALLTLVRRLGGLFGDKDSAPPRSILFIKLAEQGSTDYLVGGPQRGDVVVFRAPTQPDKDFIKRVIGLPGDTILVKNGTVFVNGTALDETYIHYPATYTYPFDGQPKQVPDGNYFVLGDNRPNSSDSHLGWFVPVDNLVGKAWISYWPPTDWGLMPSGNAVYAH